MQLLGSNKFVSQRGQRHHEQGAVDDSTIIFCMIFLMSLAGAGFLIAIFTGVDSMLALRVVTLSIIGLILLLLSAGFVFLFFEQLFLCYEAEAWRRENPSIAVGYKKVTIFFTFMPMILIFVTADITFINAATNSEFSFFTSLITNIMPAIIITTMLSYCISLAALKLGEGDRKKMMKRAILKQKALMNPDIEGLSS